ncbi:MAG: CCA tRNA nucleotidyltransferase [Candidatus Micrarchaeota archaeon]|nr:CCA tRNA nucleotidyltransferase [Candidatus Micrarchaeota archaeon]
MHDLSTKKLLFEVLEGIQPGKDEIYSEKRFTNELVLKLQKCAGSKVFVVLAGSMAKGTFLKQDNDVDIFLLFPVTVKKENFVERVKKIVNGAFPRAKYEIKYAEHPYLRVRLDGRRIDVVPAYKIDKAENLKSAVDRSVFHTKFIKGNLKKEQVAEVLLLKKFLKCNELYGAEIKIGGFSGYLCELLIVNFGTFLNFVRTTAKWKTDDSMFVDLKEYYKDDELIEKIMKKFNTRFVVIDPTDRNRNVAAAVSEENITKMIRIFKVFIKKPTRKYFSPPKSFKEKLKAIEKKHGSCYLIKLAREELADDIVWGQIRKITSALVTYLKKNEFKVKEIIMESEGKDAFICLRIGSERLANKKEIVGPEVKMKEHIIAFRKAHETAIFKRKGKRITAIVPRENIYAEKTIEKFFAKVSMPSHISFKNLRLQVHD